MTIKANKTSLYKLVAEYTSLPPMKDTRFSKLSRKHFYRLEWWSDDRGMMEAFFAASCGIARLHIGHRDYDPGNPDHQRYRLSFEELRARGMLKE